MILTAHQPCYLPWLGLFDKIHSSNVYCYLDTVQYQRGDFNNRNRILNNEKVIWLTVPVDDGSRFQRTIKDIRIFGNHWKKKHLRSLEVSYQKSKYFEFYYEKIENILLKKYNFLVDLNYDLLLFFINEIDLNVKVIKASDYDFKGKKSDLILDMCEKLKAQHYVFGSQGKNYVNQKSFEKKKITLEFQNYKHPIYTQLSKNFFPNLSIIDLLFNEGPLSKKIIINN